MVNNFISKEATNYIKGVAIIFLLIHHFFTFPNWIINNTYPMYYSNFATTTSICIDIFAFLTGYFYFFNKNKNIKYSLKKCVQVWMKYLKIFIPILIIAIITNNYEMSVENLFLDTFALQGKTMIFSLYISYYFVLIFLIYFFSKIDKLLPTYISIVFLFIPKLLVINYLPILAKIKIFKSLLFYIEYFMITGIGYLVAKYEIFIKLDKNIKLNNKYLNFTLNLVLILISLFLKGYSYFWALSSFVMIFSLSRIYNSIDNKIVFSFLKVLGEKSISIWLVHSIFFNQFRKYTQPILYFFKTPILVLIWGIILCLLIIYIIDFIIGLYKRFIYFIINN